MKAYDLLEQKIEGQPEKWLATFGAIEYAEAARWVLGNSPSVLVVERDCEPCSYCGEETQPDGQCAWKRCPSRKD